MCEHTPVANSWVVVHFEKWLFLLYSVRSVYSVVLADKITTEYTENTEKTLNKKSNQRLHGVALPSTSMTQTVALPTREYRLQTHPLTGSARPGASAARLRENGISIGTARR